MSAAGSYSPHIAQLKQSGVHAVMSAGNGGQNGFNNATLDMNSGAKHPDVLAVAAGFKPIESGNFLKCPPTTPGGEPIEYVEDIQCNSDTGPDSRPVNFVAKGCLDFDQSPSGCSTSYAAPRVAAALGEIYANYPALSYSDALAALNNSSCNPADGASGRWYVRLGATSSALLAAQIGAKNCPNAPQPIASFSHTKKGLQVSFTDLSVAISEAGSNTLTKWEWSFGDGTYSTASFNGVTMTGSASQTKSYASPGTYGVTLTVSDYSGKTSSMHQSVTVDAPSNSIDSPQINAEYIGCNNGRLNYFVTWLSDGAISYDVDYGYSMTSWNAFYDGPMKRRSYNVLPNTTSYLRARAQDGNGNWSTFSTLTVPAAPCAPAP